jgi:hypothetical protein
MATYLQRKTLQNYISHFNRNTKIWDNFLWHISKAESKQFQTFCTIEYILGHNKYKKKAIIFTLSDHNGLELEIHSKWNYRKHTNTWKFNDTFIWIIIESQKKILKLIELNKTENIT